MAESTKPLTQEERDVQTCIERVLGCLFIAACSSTGSPAGGVGGGGAGLAAGAAPATGGTVAGGVTAGGAGGAAPSAGGGTVTSTGAGGTTTTAIATLSKDGITWTFDRPVVAGQFVTGDYCIVGPATVSAIDPRPPTRPPSSTAQS